MRAPAAVSISAELEPLTTRWVELRGHSAFDRAANLVVISPPAPWLPLGMVTVAYEEVGNLPGGILLPSRVAPMRTLAPPGRRAWLEGGRLHLAGGVVALREAAIWDASLEAVSRRPRDPGWSCRWQEAWQTLHRSIGGAPASPLWGRAADVVGRLVAAVRSGALGPALHEAARLVGLGPGLTPSGDDFITGLLIGMHCQPMDARQMAIVTALGDGVEALATRTTDVSRVYLGWAVRGRATERLRDVAAAINAPRRAGALDAAIAAALYVGATSGADGLLGLLRGLQLWTKESEEHHANAA